MKGRRNVYAHAIELRPLSVKNAPRDEFRKQLEAIPYRGYEVERISDGRVVVITKPGGKFAKYGSRLRREDFMVWVMDPKDGTLWLISHKDIYNDVKAKGEQDPEFGMRVIDALKRVFQGEEPDAVAADLPPAPQNMPGEPVDLLLKAYKWIWGQEDCNYPTKQGRTMSMEDLLALQDTFDQWRSGSLKHKKLP